jgi:hypothetical protein
MLHRMSLVLCRFLNAGNEETVDAHMRPAFEKRQGTKSREVKHRRCSRLYGELVTACGLILLDVIVLADRFTSRHGCSRGVGREHCAS